MRGGAGGLRQRRGVFSYPRKGRLGGPKLAAAGRLLSGILQQVNVRPATKFPKPGVPCNETPLNYQSLTQQIKLCQLPLATADHTFVRLHRTALTEKRSNALL